MRFGERGGQGQGGVTERLDGHAVDRVLVALALEFLDLAGQCHDPGVGQVGRLRRVLGVGGDAQLRGVHGDVRGDAGQHLLRRGVEIELVDHRLGDRPGRGQGLVGHGLGLRQVVAGQRAGQVLLAGGDDQAGRGGRVDLRLDEGPAERQQGAQQRDQRDGPPVRAHEPEEVPCIESGGFPLCVKVLHGSPRDRLGGGGMGRSHSRMPSWCSLNHSTVDRRPSCRGMRAVQPASASLVTSMSLRGVPSGLVVSHSIRPS